MNYILSKACPVNNDATPLNLEQAVRECVEQGFTEKEFIEDLCGDEVRTKLLVLAREFGVEPEDVVIDPVIPGLSKCRDAKDPEAIMQVLREGEAAFRADVAAACKHGNVLRYIGSITRCKTDASGKYKYCITVKTEVVPASSVLAIREINNTAYAVEFHTECYNNPPLVVAGAHGGNKAVAAGLLADLTSLIRNLGAFDRGSIQVLKNLSQNLKGGKKTSSALLFKPPDREMARVGSW